MNLDNQIREATQKLLLEKFTREDHIFTEYNTTIDTLDLRGKEYKSKFVFFKNCTFDGLVSFENTNISVGIIFENCIFKEIVRFKDIQSSGQDKIVNPDGYTLTFKNCIFHSTFDILGKKSIFSYGILLEDCQLINEIYITEVTIQEMGLVINKCILKEELSIFKITNLSITNLVASTFENKVNISSLSSENLFIEENTSFMDILFIDKCHINKNTLFNNSFFKKEVTIVNTRIEKIFSISDSVFDKYCFISLKHLKDSNAHCLNEFYLRDSQFSSGCYLEGDNDPNLPFELIKSIELIFSFEMTGEISLSKLDIGTLLLRGNNDSSNLIIRDIKVDRFRIQEFINNGGMILSKVSASMHGWLDDDDKNQISRSHVYFDNSNLGKAQFYQVNFSSFKNVSFHNIILTEISTSLVTWFRPEQLHASAKHLEMYPKVKSEQSKEISESLSSQYRSKREIYRQLKICSERQGDVPASLDFRRYEMNYYRKLLKEKKHSSMNERLILWSNQSNDFGQNWIKPLWLLILSSFILYLPLGFFCSSQLDYTHFAHSAKDWALNFRVIFIDNLKNWFLLLNPAHSFKDLKENTTSFPNFFYGWDLFSRIIVAYFIFQIVSAFRKFNKGN